MSSFDLRPLSLGELLDRAFLLYRRNFALFAGIMVIPACAMLPFQFLVLHLQGAPLPFHKTAPRSPVQLYVFGVLLVYWVIYTVAQAATTYAVADAYLGRLSTIRDSYGKIRGRFWRLIGLSVNVALRVFGLMLLIVMLASIVGGVLGAALSSGRASPSPLALTLVFAVVFAAFAFALWLAVRYAISLPAVLLEDISGSAAIRRSVQLSQGRRGPLVVGILLSIVVLYAVALLFQGPFYATIVVMRVQGGLPSWLSLGMALSSLAGGIIAGPLLMIILVLFYYDLRIRKEAFDLQQMMAALPHQDSTSPSPGPA